MLLSAAYDMGLSEFFLQICLYESLDSQGQKSLRLNLEVVHPFWDS